MLIVDRAGANHPAGTCHVTNGNGTAGYRLSIPLPDISEIQLHAPTPTGFQLTART
jgi:hypothetical protein